MVKGVLRVCGLTESKRRKEQGFWIQSSQMTCGKPQVTAELAGRRQRSPEGKTWRKQ